MKTASLLTPLVAALAVALVSTGCDKRSHIKTTGAGHQITADIQGQVSVESGTNQTVIVSQFGSVMIERGRASHNVRQPSVPPFGRGIQFASYHARPGTFRLLCHGDARERFP